MGNGAGFAEEDVLVRQLADDRFQAGFRLAAVGLAHAGPDGRLLEVNGTFASLLGRSVEDLTGCLLAELLHPEDLGVMDELAGLHFQGQRQTSLVLRLHHRDEGWLWARLAVSLLSGPCGELLCYILALEDGTAWRQIERALQRTTICRDRILGHASNAIFILDGAGSFTSGNPAGQGMTGFCMDDLAGRHFSALWPEAEWPRIEQVFGEVLSAGRPASLSEVRLQHREGYPVTVSLYLDPVLEAGQVMRLICVLNAPAAQPLHDYQRVEDEIRRLNVELEQRVSERTAQLSAVNQELEAFCYSVSHDLRAPLRAINGFSQALAEDCKGALSREGELHLGRICQATQRMGQLIEDLLKLSRMTRSEMCREWVNLSTLARSICADLRTRQPERQVACVIAPNVVAHGDPRLLHIVLENLLGNAWKFTGKKPAASVEFGSSIIDGRRTFFVQDDGAGFDMNYADKLFGAFQRLHGYNEFEGTGIGLATAQRIIHRHGGQIWGEGEIGKGATFYFTVKDCVDR
ncbi:PAS domain S-box protein [Thermithiobacillus plumbiphilus]|uniref:histidine kinase n=1 Tax=Thermithiobacillus plumbiphilus TaxID=1729899 RepID=A0ABU9DC64_9PROT